MKKILLSLGLFSLVLVGKSQVVLNEIYADPGSGKSEFIELFNSSAGAISSDCITILTYYVEGANTGWYVIDLPAGVIAPKGWYTIAAANPFNVQSQSGVIANANWNSLAASGYLQKWQRSGGTYISVAPGTVTDLMQEESPAGANGNNYFVFLLQNGVKSNAFVGGGASGTLPVGITSMPNLNLTPTPGSCGAAFSVNFSTWGAVEFKNQSGGNDNGYARTCDGRCGTWVKTSSSVNHTPNSTNGSATTCVTGSMATNETLNCNLPRFVLFDVTGAGTSGVTNADDFPVDVTVYADVNLNGLDGADIAINTKSLATIEGPSDTVQLGIYQNFQIIVVYETKRGCYDKIVVIPNTCLPLPVEFKSFTATRQNANVMVRWETSMEMNNSGFAIERNVNGTWQQIAWIPSQAQGGNSDAPLAYSYVDYNSTRGISQYRIRQEDFDSKSKYTEIRSVRGEGQLGNTIVYPNPSNDGKVNIVFEGAAGNRDIAVTDMSGRIVKQLKAITNNNITIDNLQPGMYMVRIVDTETGAQVVEKIVVNKR